MKVVGEILKIKSYVKKTSLVLILIFLCQNIFAQSRTSESPVQLYNKALEFQNQEDYYSAIEIYKTVLDLNPQYADAWYNLALCTYNLGNYDLTITYADNAAKYSPNLSTIQNLKGMALLSLGNFSEARNIFNSVLEKYPNDVNSRFGLAELDLYEGKISSAEGRYEQALARDSTNRKALLSLALISSEEGNYNLTKKYLDQALFYHSGNPQVHYLASYLASQNGDFKEAENQAKTAIQIQNNFEEAYILLSQILYEQKRYAEVLELCEYITNQNRNSVSSWYLMGLSQEKLNQNEDAISSFETGLDVNPEDEVLRLALEQLISSFLPLEDERRNSWATYHKNKALEYARIYDSPSERFEYQKALSIAPFDIQLRQNFADMLEKQNLYELYYEQLKFINQNANSLSSSENSSAQQNQQNQNSSENSKSATQIKNQDSMEALENLMKYNLSAKWNVEPFYLDKTRWNLGIYFEKKLQLIHSDLEEIIANAAKDVFDGVSSTSVDVMAESVDGFADAFRNARENNRDYFVILTASETERSFRLDANVYSQRTGTLTSSIHIYRTGNDRIAKTLRTFRQSILDILPIRGKVLKISGTTVLLDLGKNDGVETGSQFDLVKKGSILTNDSGPGIFYKSDALLGTVNLTRVNEEISEGEYTKKGFYNTMNLGDEVVLIRDNPASSQNLEGNIANDTRPAANNQGEIASDEARNAQLERIKEDLKTNLEESELLRLIQNINQ